MLKCRTAVYVFTANSIFCLNKQPKASMFQVRPRLSELRTQPKVRVKVQILGVVSICECAVECSAAIVCYVGANDRSAEVM